MKLISVDYILAKYKDSKLSVEEVAHKEGVPPDVLASAIASRELEKYMEKQKKHKSAGKLHTKPIKYP